MTNTKSKAARRKLTIGVSVGAITTPETAMAKRVLKDKNSDDRCQ
jgi:hypothetical protein